MHSENMRTVENFTFCTYPNRDCLSFGYSTRSRAVILLWARKSSFSMFHVEHRIHIRNAPVPRNLLLNSPTTRAFAHVFNLYLP